MLIYFHLIILNVFILHMHMHYCFLKITKLLSVIHRRHGIAAERISRVHQVIKY